MNWVFRTLGTSVGKKQVMAVTGMLFLLFLAVHLIGNLTIYGGVPAFNAYVDKLHGLGALLAVPQRAPAQGTAFSYQGRLVEQGAPAEGRFDCAACNPRCRPHRLLPPNPPPNLERTPASS